MPYLPIDPKDVGRSYEAVIRVNSQSGKGGISYLLETEFGMELPRRLQIEFSRVVQAAMDASGKEFTARDIFDEFEREYGLKTTAVPQHQVIEEQRTVEGTLVALTAQVQMADRAFDVRGTGNGPIDAFVEGLSAACGETIRVLDYHEHAIGAGANARAVAYLELRVGERTLFGVGIDSNIVSASLKAIVSGVQRASAHRKDLAWQTS
jgi:2-isopropylmalate synthase